MSQRKLPDERPFLKSGISMGMVRAAEERFRTHVPEPKRPRRNVVKERIKL